LPSCSASVGSTTRAHTTVTPPEEPLPIHFFAPFSTHSSPSRRASVSSETESEPWSGSVRANAASTSPRAIGRSHSAFCASLPNSATDLRARPPCTARIVPSDPSPREISMLTSPAASGDE